MCQRLCVGELYPQNTPDPYGKGGLVTFLTGLTAISDLVLNRATLAAQRKGVRTMGTTIDEDQDAPAEGGEESDEDMEEAGEDVEKEEGDEETM